MGTEVESGHQRGIALTHESVGGAKAGPGDGGSDLRPENSSKIG